MAVSFHSASYPWLQRVLRHRSWLLVGLVILCVVMVRVHLRDMPLERDEGEHAYAGQLMLHGELPYQYVHTAELPGTYAAFALIMGVLGQSASGIHLGLALVNVASILIVFQLGRRLLDDATAVAAVVAFALLSLSPSVQGLGAHATHFVVLAALGGTLVLLSACEGEGRRKNAECRSQNADAPRPSPLALRSFLAGLLFGLALVMEQRGVFFGLFGMVYLLRVRVGEWLAVSGTRKQQPGVRSLRERIVFDFKSEASRAARARLIRHVAMFGLGWLLPCGMTCGVLWLAGTLDPFEFRAISSAGQYASAIPIVRGPDVLRAGLRAVASPDVIFWILPCVGALMMWWDSRLDDGASTVEIRSPQGGAGQSPTASARPQVAYPRFFLMAWLLCSFASASVGFHFQEHYLIVVLPALALFTGVAVSRGLHLLQHDQTVELFLALPIVGLFGIAVCAALLGHGAVWLAAPPDQSMDGVLGTTLFAETARVGDYLKAHAPQDAPIAVLGSEPEIYFYSHRRGATGQIYAYPLMEETPHALKLQEEMIAELERAQPAYIVYVDDPLSWRPRPKSPQRLFEWWRTYWATELDLVMTVPVGEQPAGEVDMDRPAKESPPARHILVFKRRSSL